MSNDDFLAAMSDVSQIKTVKRVTKKAKKTIDIQEGMITCEHHVPNIDIHRVEGDFFFHEKGFSKQAQHKITQSQHTDATLDLHGLYVQPALNACVIFLKKALASKYRVIKIIHGRGLHSPDGRPILKQEVFRWLKEGSYANSILSVKPIQSGGASLVVLRRQRK